MVYAATGAVPATARPWAVAAAAEVPGADDEVLMP